MPRGIKMIPPKIKAAKAAGVVGPRRTAALQKKVGIDIAKKTGMKFGGGNVRNAMQNMTGKIKGQIKAIRARRKGVL